MLTYASTLAAKRILLVATYTYQPNRKHLLKIAVSASNLHHDRSHENTNILLYHKYDAA